MKAEWAQDFADFLFFGQKRENFVCPPLHSFISFSLPIPFPYSTPICIGCPYSQRSILAAALDFDISEWQVNWFNYLLLASEYPSYFTYWNKVRLRQSPDICDLMMTIGTVHIDIMYGSQVKCLAFALLPHGASLGTIMEDFLFCVPWPKGRPSAFSPVFRIGPPPPHTQARHTGCF